MIIVIVGGIGTGKSVTATKKVIDSKHPCFCNWNIKSPHVTRIKKEHIIQEVVTGVTKSGKETKDYRVNWDFWNKTKDEQGDFNLMLDEIHNLIHSRQSMTKFNTIMSIWISQIRKILGDKEHTHIYLVTQKLRRIDVAFRDLLHVIIACRKYISPYYVLTPVVEDGLLKYKELPVTWIINHYFSGDYAVERFEAWNLQKRKTYDFRTRFIANPYYQFYNTHEVLGETGYL